VPAIERQVSAQEADAVSRRAACPAILDLPQGRRLDGLRKTALDHDQGRVRRREPGARRMIRGCMDGCGPEAQVRQAELKEHRPYRLGIGRDVVLDRVIVDKNARIGDGSQLVNESGIQKADGDGYFIRDGVIIVPKDGIVRPGTRV
jgi:hypothetical protein